MRQPRQLIIVVFALVALIATGCGSSGADPSDPPSGGDAAVRTVRHAMGSTEITGKPKRVVVLDTGELDSVLALGVTPAGAVRTDTTSGLQSYLAGRAKDVTMVGSNNQPNLEAIAALQPDLILSSKLRHEALYEKFSGIAPTVFAEKYEVTWKENLLLAGDALGKRSRPNASWPTTSRRLNKSANSSVTPARWR